MNHSARHAIVRYSGTAMLLHWGLAVALVAIFALGVYMHELPFSPTRLKLYNWHKWAGIAILALSAFRLVWRLSHPAPALHDAVLAAMPGWQHVAHSVTHVAMYALFFIVPVLGWTYSSATGFQVVFLGLWPLPDLVPANEALAETLKGAHAIAAWTLALLVVMHVAAAFKHHLINRDGLMQRMLPGGD